MHACDVSNFFSLSSRRTSSGKGDFEKKERPATRSKCHNSFKMYDEKISIGLLRMDLKPRRAPKIPVRAPARNPRARRSFFSQGAGTAAAVVVSHAQRTPRNVFHDGGERRGRDRTSTVDDHKCIRGRQRRSHPQGGREAGRLRGLLRADGGGGGGAGGGWAQLRQGACKGMGSRLYPSHFTAVM